MVADITDRLQPQYAVLGAMLIDQSTIGTCVQQLDTEDFTDKPCRVVFQTIRRMWAGGMAIDPVTVRDQLDGFDGATAFIVELMDIVPTCKNLDSYIAALKKQAAMDSIRQIAAELQEAQTVEEMTELLARANAVSIRKKERPCMDAAEMLKSFAEDHATDTEPKYFPWAYRKLENQMFAEPGDVVVIAGRPSDGKTAFALVNGWEQAKQYRVGFYSLETGVKKIRDRSLAQLLCIDMGNIKRNKITDAEWQSYGIKSGGLASRTFKVIEAAGMTVDEIFADAMARGFEIIYIDYLQIISPTNPREMNRTSIVTDISVRIHQHSRSTGIMTVALAQLNRSSVSSGKARRPELSDLRESGQIEQDADAITFIWREDPEQNDADRHVFTAKNKEGRIGSFDLTMVGKYQQFLEKTDLVSPVSRAKQTPVIGGEYKQLTEDDPAMPF